MTSDQDVERLIITVRGQRVIVDADLARLYKAETKALNRAVKRNAKRFPPDFMFQLTAQETNDLRYQFGTSKPALRNRAQPAATPEKRSGRRYRPYAFTEHGGALQVALLVHDSADATFTKSYSRCSLQRRGRHGNRSAFIPKLRPKCWTGGKKLADLITKDCIQPAQI